MLKFNCSRLMAIALGSALTLTAPVLAQPVAAQGLAGPYLAAVQASYRNDYVTAAQFFSEAVMSDQDNTYLLQNAVMNNVVAGNFDTAVPLAGRLAELDADRQIAGLVLVSDAVSRDDFGAALNLLKDESFGFNTLLKGLLTGWVTAGLGDIEAAQSNFDSLGEDTGFGPLGQYHKALVLALAGNFDGSAEIFAGDGETPLQVSRASLVAHIQVLLQLDLRDEAVALIDDVSGGTDPELAEMKARIEGGEDVQFDAVRSARDGAAEVFLTLATALSREEADVFALLYARLAQHVRPDYVDALLLSADILSAQEQYDLAIADFAQVPKSSGIYRDAEIGRASAMSASGDAGGAIDALSDLAASFPDDAYIHVSLGDTFRSEERYSDAVDSYSRAIALSPEEQPSDWRNYYVRGISHERLDMWDEAEADFRKALELQPGQALVLNYLGYSLVEKNMKIDEARAMIEEAVAGDPNNGYITDSLGWVLYKIGKFEEAVPHMERAAELLPSDPVINDHLGDVLWKVGRRTEAVFQWKRALSFDDETDEADPERIRRKIEVGLDVVLEEEASSAN